MEMMVTTESFSYRARNEPPVAESDAVDAAAYKDVDLDEFKTFETSHWPLVGYYKPTSKDAHESKYVEEIRIELKEENMGADGLLEGRVFMNLKETTRVDSIDVDVNYSLMFTDTNGEQTLQKSSENFFIPVLGPQNMIKHQETHKMTNAGTLYNKATNIGQGTRSIPFTLNAKKGVPPSFTFISKDGASVISSYSAQAVVRIAGKTVESDRVAFKVPSFGQEGVPVVTPDAGKLQLGLESKYCTPDTGVSFVVGDEKDKEKHIEAVIRRKIHCPDIGLTTVIEDVIASDKIKKERKKDSPIAKRLEEMGKPLAGHYKSHFDKEFSLSSGLLPSVSLDGFKCDYEVAIEHKEGTFETDVIVCDYLIGESFEPTCVNQGAKQSIGWRKVE